MPAVLVAALFACRVELNPDFIEAAAGTTAGSTTDTGTTTSVTTSGTMPATGTTTTQGATTTTVTGDPSSSTTDPSGTSGGPSCANTFYDVPGPPTGGVRLGVNMNFRAGVEVRLGSALVGSTIECWTPWLNRRDIQATGPVAATIRDGINDEIVAMFVETLSAEELGLEYAPVTFTLAEPYVIVAGDRILIEYGGPSAVRVGDVDNVFDTGLTRRTRFQGMTYGGGGQSDGVGTMAGP